MSERDATTAAGPSATTGPRTPRHAGRSLAVALGTALVLLTGLELGARWARLDAPGAHSYEAPRNPTFRRGWAAFTAPRSRPADRKLIVVLTNSQGFIREQEDGSLAYPSRLASGLAERGVDAIVANWSVPGAQGPELVVLAARAAQHAPDLVILSTGTRGFGLSKSRTAPLSFWASDVADLAYERGVRRRLPASFLLRSHAFDALGFLRAHSAFVRLRTLLEAADENSSWRTSPRKKRGNRRLSLRPPDVETIRLLLTEFSAALRPDGEATPLLLVNMPICRPGWMPAAYRRTRVLSQVADDLFADDPRTRILDARTVVPEDEFTSSTHLTPDGHQAYADWLLPHVLAALAGEEPATGR